MSQNQEKNIPLFENLQTIFSEELDSYLNKNARLAYIYKETQIHFLKEIYRLCGSTDDIQNNTKV
jgi:hypothetical protein